MQTHNAYPSGPRAVFPCVSSNLHTSVRSVWITRVPAETSLIYEGDRQISLHRWSVELRPLVTD